MGVYSDLINPRPFNLGGISGFDTKARIRQKANASKLRGEEQRRNLQLMTETGGIQPKTTEVAPAITPKYAGELLRTHRKLIDNLIDQVMFG